MSTTDLWQYSIVPRGDYDDAATTIPCTECGENCGGETLKVPLHWAVVKYENSEPKFICETCTTNAGADFLWKLAKAIDEVDCLFYSAADGETLIRIANMADHCIGRITEQWRHMAANGL